MCREKHVDNMYQSLVRVEEAIIPDGKVVEWSNVIVAGGIERKA